MLRGWPSMVVRFFQGDPGRQTRQALRAEILRNRQRLYVGQQRAEPQELAGDAARCLLADCPPGLDPAVLEYARRVTGYDQLYQECRAYEQWYAADPSRQTREHAVILHEKKEQRAALFGSLAPVILAAAQAVDETSGG